MKLKALLNTWGWEAAPPSLQAYAQFVLDHDLIGRKVGDAIIAMGLATDEEIGQWVKNEPQTPVIRHLVKNKPDCAAQAPKALAAQSGLAFYEVFDKEIVHPDMIARGDVSATCSRQSAVLLQTDTGRPVLVFADIAALRDYESQGTLMQKSDPLRALYGQSLCLGMSYQRLIVQAKAHSAVIEHDKDAQKAQSNYWSSGAATTDALRTLADLLDAAVQARVTDVDLTTVSGGTGVARFRVDGDLEIARRTISREDMQEIARFLGSRSGANPQGGRLTAPADGQMIYECAAGSVFVRCSFIPVDIGMPEVESVSIALRLMSQGKGAIVLENLNLPQTIVRDIRRHIQLSRGIVLMVGPTGSGKSTTIAGCLDLHRQMFGESKKRLSIEDPIERYIDCLTQFNAAEGQKAGAFGRAIKAFMRHDPDVIWVGEVRDQEAATAAIRAANTGHLVFTTFHANDTILGFKELADMLDPSRVINFIESLSLILSQRLIKKLCPDCRLQGVPSATEREMFAFYTGMYGESVGTLPERVWHRNPDGCPKCNLGIQGRVPIMESLPVTRPVKNLMREVSRNGAYDFEAISAKRTLSLLRSGLDLVATGDVELLPILD